MLFTLIFVYFIVALNVFVKGGCSAGWLQNKRESYLHLFVYSNHTAGHPPFTKTFSATIKYIKISLNNIHVCFVTILLDILPSQRHSVLQ
jgi:hypothetical protein